MAGEFIASLGIFKSIYDSAKALKDINDAAIRNGAVVELQEKILAAREAQTNLLERISTLEKEVATFETWEAEKKRYELIALSPNTMAYSIKESMRGSEPPHHICANCYSAGKKSFLKQTLRGPIVFKYECHVCGDQLIIDNSDGRPRSPIQGRSGGGHGGGPDGWMGN